MDVITSQTDLFPSTVPGSNQQIEMFDKGTSGEMDMSEFISYIQDEYGVSSVMKVLQIAAFMLCCDVISQDIAKSTLRLRERLPNGTSRIVMPTQHPVAALLALEPNRRHTWIQYNEMTVLWSCLTSNAYAVCFRAKDGTPLELVPVQTGRVNERIAGREVFYDIMSSTQQELALLGSAFMTVPERDMIHVRKRMLDGMDGFSTMDAGRNTLNTATQLDSYRSKLFGEEGQIRGVFTRAKDGAMDDVAFARLRSQFRVLMSKFKSGTDPIVLEDGITFQPISSKPSDMELSKQFEAQINEVCRLLRVPPHKVFLMSGTKYENLETQEKMYVGDTLVPVAKHHEQSTSRVVLTREERLRYFLEYDRAEMTLRDTKLETERAIEALKWGAYEIDEVRAVFGANPLPNGAGQVRLIQSTMIAVNRKNEVIISAADAQPDPQETQEPADEGKTPNQTDEPSDDEVKGFAGLRVVSSN
jgi:HK97 family phage portal protein